VSKRTNGRYEPDRRTWLKIKCLNREEFVVVGWSDPEGNAVAVSGERPMKAANARTCRT
jgi:ATP-dependent DNA ligase